MILCTELIAAWSPELTGYWFCGTINLKIKPIKSTTSSTQYTYGRKKTLESSFNGHNHVTRQVEYSQRKFGLIITGNNLLFRTQI